VTFIDYCGHIFYSLSRMPVDKYIESTNRFMTWSKLPSLNVFIDKLLELLKEDQLTPKFDISTMISTVKSFGDLSNAVELKYIEKDKDEVNEDGAKKREKEIKDCYKLKLKNEALKMTLAVSVLGKCAQLTH